VWSVDADSSRPKVNALSLRPLVNINLPRGWFITSKPNILADWTASGDDRWLVEAGGGIGRVMRIGNFGITLESQFFGYPVKPDRAPSWATRFTITVTFRRGQLRGRFAAPETIAARE
jgi:hypothetical protein